MDVPDQYMKQSADKQKQEQLRQELEKSVRESFLDQYIILKSTLEEIIAKDPSAKACKPSQGSDYLSIERGSRKLTIRICDYRGDHKCSIKSTVVTRSEFGQNKEQRQPRTHSLRITDQKKFEWDGKDVRSFANSLLRELYE